MGSAFQIYSFLAWKELYRVCLVSADYMPVCQYFSILHLCKLGMKRNAATVSMTVVLPSRSIRCSKGNSNSPRPEAGKSQVLVYFFKQVLLLVGEGEDFAV